MTLEMLIQWHQQRASDCFSVIARHMRARKIRRVIGELEAIELQSDPTFAAPRDVYVDLDMAIHQLESAMSKMRAAWWP